MNPRPKTPKAVIEFYKDNELHKYLVEILDQNELRWNQHIPMRNTLVRDLLFGMHSYYSGSKISVVKSGKRGKKK